MESHPMKSHASQVEDADESNAVSERSPAEAQSAPDQTLDRVDETSAESFPASDPPAWVGMRVGGPAARSD
jgi:hypothetical protein